MQIRYVHVVLALLAGAFLLGCSRQTAEEKGKELATAKIDLVKGVGEALKEKGSQAAESLAQGTGKVLQGAGDGFDKAFEWKLTHGSGMVTAGLTVPRVGKAASRASEGNAIDVYVVAEREAVGTLSMIAFDARHREMARTSKELKIGTNSSSYETLVLDERAPVDTIREVAFDFVPGAIKAGN